MKEKTGVAGSAPPARSTYRHGDLRRALLEAGVELARQGGPEAVVLREATRRAGVVPNAAYRHFASRQALLLGVRAAALAAAATAMETELAAVPPEGEPAERARAAVRAIGAGYLRFALEQTGLFRTAFGAPVDVVDTTGEAKGGASGLNPFELLGAALDQMVAAGVLPPARRPGAEYLAWSAVHGLALLIIDGPLRGAPREQIDALSRQLLAMVEKGL
ncbi:TetR/AcrR family transcriptional regulator [Variovorax sp. JS1663]|uniref:TetR/AcrR family transcriptional regulator n=1 Tax=Variovorax sp. JS1663 TaxID=1851577 RepID=UPI000B346F4D|nr:TetR/AcrR family transcriptional regulator [Variovorax sp. JS1663]OUL98050.1 TetR family transcriptional regulator [Variovorax sp. JS1663]